MSTGRRQKAVAPLVVALLGRIREAAYKVHREHGDRPSTVFALDELYGLAPLPDLPAMLTDGGSGLLVVGAVQDLTLIKSRWPNEAAGFLTLFGNVLVFPGIRDTTTLDAVSKLIGDEDREMVFKTYGGPRTTEQHLTQRQAIYAPSQISAGIEPGNPDVLLFLHQWGWDKVRATPWWRFGPWPQVLTAYLARALSGRVPEWRIFEYLETRGDQPDVPDVIARLPLPNLRRWADEWQQDRQYPLARAVGSVPADRDPPEARAAEHAAPRAVTWELDLSWTTPGKPWSIQIPHQYL